MKLLTQCLAAIAAIVILPTYASAQSQQTTVNHATYLSSETRSYLQLSSQGRAVRGGARRVPATSVQPPQARRTPQRLGDTANHRTINGRKMRLYTPGVVGISLIAGSSCYVDKARLWNYQQ